MRNVKIVIIKIIAAKIEINLFISQYLKIAIFISTLVLVITLGLKFTKRFFYKSVISAMIFQTNCFKPCQFRQKPYNMPFVSLFYRKKVKSKTKLKNNQKRKQSKANQKKQKQKNIRTLRKKRRNLYKSILLV